MCRRFVHISRSFGEFSRSYKKVYRIISLSLLRVWSFESSVTLDDSETRKPATCRADLVDPISGSYSSRMFMAVHIKMNQCESSSVNANSTHHLSSSGLR